MKKVGLLIVFLFLITYSTSDASVGSLFGLIAKEALKATASEAGKTVVEEFKKLFNHDKEIAKKGKPELKEGKLVRDKRMWTISRGNLSRNDLKELAKILKSIDNDTDQVIKVNGSDNVVATTQSGNVNFGNYQEILGGNLVISSQGQSGGITAQNVNNYGTIVNNELEKAPSKDTAKSKPKLPPTTAELEQNLREQIEFLLLSTEYFDNGKEDEAKRIATNLHILFVDMEDSPSLLEQMRIRDKLRLPNTAHEDVKGNQAAYMGLLSHIASTNRIGLIANCLLCAYDGSTAKSIPFADWWGEVVLDNREGLVFTRESLVKGVAEQDGGIRVASGLDPKYVELARKSGMGWRTVIRRKTEKGWTITEEPSLGEGLHSIRQIAWEVLDAMSRQYPQYFPKTEVSPPDRSTPHPCYRGLSIDSVIVQ